MLKILGIGNALVDILVRLETDDLLNNFGLPRGSMQLVDSALSDEILKAAKRLETTMASGGSAANTIHGLATLGVQTGYIGSIGDDSYGAFFRKDMFLHNIKATLLHGSQPTGKAVVLVSADSERTFATFLGAALELGPEQLETNYFKGYDLLYLEGYLVQNYELVEKAIYLSSEAGLKVCLDLASYNVVEAHRDFLAGLVKNSVDIIFANEEEAKALTGLGPLQASEWLAAHCGIAVVKTGSEGSVVRNREEHHQIGIFPAMVRDTTGAGDLYSAGFLFGWTQGLPLKICGELGKITAGHVIQVVGPKMTGQNWNAIREEIRRLGIAI